MLLGLTACSRELGTAERNDSATAAPPVALPACKAGDARTGVTLWMPTYSEWKQTLSSAPAEQNGKMLYIKFGKASMDKACGTPKPFFVPAARDLKDPRAGGVEVGFRGNSTARQGWCHVEGFFMNEVVVAYSMGWSATAYEAVDTKDVILSGRYCLADRVKEPTATELEGLGVRDRIVSIERAKVINRIGPRGHRYQEARLYFSPLPAGPVTAGCNLQECIELAAGARLAPLKAKVGFRQDPAADPGAEPWVERLQALK